MSTTSPLMPTKPIMGGIVQTSMDEWTPWTGGKPMIDWTGLDPTAPVMFRSPNQQQSLYTKSATDGYNFRMTGLTVKFGKNNNFKKFSENALQYCSSGHTEYSTIAASPWRS